MPYNCSRLQKIFYSVFLKERVHLPMVYHDLNVVCIIKRREDTPGKRWRKVHELFNIYEHMHGLV